MILRKFGLTEIMPRLFAGVRRLAVRTHDATSRGDPLIKKALHDRFLIHPVRQSHAVALPVGACPFRLDRQTQALDVSQQLGIAGGEGATTDTRSGSRSSCLRPTAAWTSVIR